MMKPIYTVFKMLSIFYIILACVIPVAFRSFFIKKDLNFGLRMRQKAAKRIIKALKIQIDCFNQPQLGNYLYVSNHQSYLDPVIVKNWILFQAVAKAEIGKWPLIGFGVKHTGTIFVKRENKLSRTETLSGIRISLQQSIPVLIFPEGTTHHSKKTLPFRMGSFKIAAEERVGVLPIALHFENPILAFVGNDTFIPHFYKVCCLDEIKVKVAFASPIYNENPEELMFRSQEVICDLLSDF